MYEKHLEQCLAQGILKRKIIIIGFALSIFSPNSLQIITTCYSK